MGRRRSWWPRCDLCFVPPGALQAPVQLAQPGLPVVCRAVFIPTRRFRRGLCQYTSGLFSPEIRLFPTPSSRELGKSRFRKFIVLSGPGP
eukprot:9021473-Pyramimonas_sp.AAC.1